MAYSRNRGRPKKIDPLIISEYVLEDNSCWINDDDPDLTPIKVDLPKAPNFQLIEGYGVDKKDQVFAYESYPLKLKNLEALIKNKVRKHRKKDSAKKIERLFIDEMWTFLENNHEEYKDEIVWIKKQWYHRIYGYWFFCNGKPTYLNGWNWSYLNYCKLQGNIEHNGLPEYRDRDRRWFHAQLQFFNDTSTIEYEIVTKDGKKVRKPLKNLDGSIRTIDFHTRTVYGTNNLKARRVGETSKTGWINVELTTRNKEFNSGIQGDADATGKTVFTKHVIYPYKRMPWFFKPYTPSGINPQHEIVFEGDDLDLSLGSRIDYATTVHRNFYDSTRLDFYHCDEGGKCLGANELVKMTDGSVRKIIDVNINDSLLGMDGTPRKVLDKFTNSGKLYKIVPNKGREWFCNDKHILTLKGARALAKTFGADKGEIFDIDIEDYLNGSDSARKHSVLFRGIAEYKKNQHVLPPYFLGLYLGDGCSTSGRIATTDIEIVDYLKRFADSNGYILSKDKKISYLIHNNNKNNKNPIRVELNNIGVLKNKHIPEDYLFDSKDNRFNLLAGLLDTDGNINKSTNGKPKSYEITQVRKDLSYQIYELAKSLGYYTHISKKKTSMKREDGSYYRGIAYRVTIYGDLWKIPCKIERKIAIDCEFSINRRNPLHTGFKIQDGGIGEYCGLTVDGDNRFMLDDYTVIHNCYREDITRRHLVVKTCLVKGSIINGFTIYTSTVGEMDGKTAGDRFLELTQNSHYEKRDENGQTKSGLVNVFFSAADGLAGFIGKYGESIISNPTEEQVEHMGTKIKVNGTYIGAMEFIENRRKPYIDTDDFELLSNEKREYPLIFRECFTPPASSILWNINKLQQRLQEIRFGNVQKPLRGNFFWVDGFGGDVDFRVDNNGRWLVSSKLKSHEVNKRYNQGGILYPGNADIFISSADPYKHERTEDGRRSDGGGAVRWMKDITVDSEDSDIQYMKSKLPVCTYRNRPASRELYAEDMLMMTMYYGALMYPENNIPLIYEKFEKWGFRGYLMYDVEPLSRKRKTKPGWTTGDKTEMFGLAADDIDQNCHRWTHEDLIMECLDIKRIEDLTKYDILTAHMGTLLGEKSRYANRIARANRLKVNLGALNIPKIK